MPATATGDDIPHLSEAWYCCAEPTADQFVAIAGGVAKTAQLESFF